MQHFARRCYKAVKERVTVSTEFIFFLAVAFLLVPVQWLGGWMLALTIHELCHCIALWIFGGAVSGVRISCRGVIMETQPLSLGKEAICAYAGPLGALLILPVARYLPRTAICTLVFSAYNLLPIFPLDGGRGLGCIIKKVFPGTIADRLQRYVENAVLIGVVIIAVYSVFQLGLGLFPAVIAVILLCRSKGIKFPCKKCLLGLQ